MTPYQVRRDRVIGRRLARARAHACIERITYSIRQPMSDDQRECAYFIRLRRSPRYDRHEHAHRVADGLRALARLNAHWRRKALEKALAAQPARPALEIVRRAKKA